MDLYLKLFRAFLDPDTGAPSGGGEGGDATVSAGEGQGAEAAAGGDQPFDYEGFAGQFGGREGLQRDAGMGRDVRERMRLDPKFREHVQKAWRGDYGPEAQADAKQAVGAGQGAQAGQQAKQPHDLAWLDFEPNKMVQLRELHSALKDPDRREAVLADPMNREALAELKKLQDFQNGLFWSPHNYLKQMNQHPAIAEQRREEQRQIAREEMQQIRDQFYQAEGERFYQSNKAAIDALPAQIKAAIQRGAYGPTVETGGTIFDSINSIKAALQLHQQQLAAGVPKPPTPEAAGGAPAAKPRAVNGKPPNEQPGKKKSGFGAAMERATRDTRGG